MILGERPSAIQLLGVALVLTGVVVAVTGGTIRTDRTARIARQAAGDYSRASTRIIRQASGASTGESTSKLP